jgi:hypothetical protein
VQDSGKQQLLGSTHQSFPRKREEVKLKITEQALLLNTLIMRIINLKQVKKAEYFV